MLDNPTLWIYALGVVTGMLITLSVVILISDAREHHDYRNNGLSGDLYRRPEIQKAIPEHPARLRTSISRCASSDA